MKARKEVTIAVIIGLVIALLVTGGILRARKALQNLQQNMSSFTSPSKTKESTSPENQALNLALTTPDNSVVNVGSLVITGQTLPGTYIAILGEKGEYLIVPTELGSFSQEVALVKGANNIVVTVYQVDGTKVSKTLSAVYTTADL